MGLKEPGSGKLSGSGTGKYFLGDKTRIMN